MNKKPLTILPTNQLLQQIWDYIISRPGKRVKLKKRSTNVYICFAEKPD